MKNKLDNVSIQLIRGLVSSSVEYWKAQIKIKNLYGNEELGETFHKVNPVFELAEALGMDLHEDIWPSIKAVLLDEITEAECIKEIVNKYEEFFIDRLIKKEQSLENFFYDMNAESKEGIRKTGLIVSVIQMNRYRWRVIVVGENVDVSIPDGLDKENFKTKLEAMEYVLQIGEKHHIIEVKV